MSRKFSWSKNVLIHQIDNQSYEKALLGQTNFDQALKPELRAQAKLAVKDEYTFDFLELGWLACDVGSTGSHAPTSPPAPSRCAQWFPPMVTSGKVPSNPRPDPVQGRTATPARWADVGQSYPRRRLTVPMDLLPGLSSEHSLLRPADPQFALRLSQPPLGTRRQRPAHPTNHQHPAPGGIRYPHPQAPETEGRFRGEDMKDKQATMETYCDDRPPISIDTRPPLRGQHHA